MDCCGRCASAMARRSGPPCRSCRRARNRPSLIFVDGFVYTTTTSGCGATPNAVWSIDLTAPVTETDRNPARKVSSWQTGGAGCRGHDGTGVRHDGTIYSHLTSRSGSGPATGDHANAVVALDRQTLEGEGLVHRGRAVHDVAGRDSPQGQGSDRGGRERRQGLSARQRVAGRKRSQDAARGRRRGRHGWRGAAAGAGRDARQQRAGGVGRWDVEVDCGAGRQSHRHVQDRG